VLSVNKLQISGFRSVGSASPIALDLTPGAFLVEGMNGAGKTTIASEALYWLLFGKSLRGSVVATVVNRDSEEAVVVGEFVRDDGVCVTVVRRRTKAGKHTFSIADANGKDLLADAGVGTTVTARGDIVCQLLKLTSEIVKATAFYSPTDSLLSLGDTERRKLLEGLLDVDWVDAAREKVKCKMTDARNQQATLTKQVAFAEGSISVLRSEAARLRSDAAGLDAKVAEGAAPIEAAIAIIDQRTAMLTEQIAVQRAAVDDVNARMPELNVDVQRYNVGVNDARQNRAGLVSKLNGYRMVLVTHQRNLDKALSELERMRTTTCCPTCAQTLPEGYYEDAMNKALAEERTARETVDSARVSHDAVVAELAAVDSVLADAEAKLKEAVAAQQLATQRVTTANNTIAMASRELAQLATKRARHDAELLALVNLEAAKAKLEADARVKDEEAAKQDAVVVDLTYQRDEVVATQLNRLAWWSTAFGPKGIRAFALEELVFDLTRRANEYLSFMTEGRLVLEASTTKQTTKGDTSETLEFRVLNAMGIDSYADASTGERRLADIALTVALYDTTSDLSGVGGLGYMVFDEALDSLDASYAQAVVDLFARLGARGICIGTISHSEEVQGNFPVAWRVGRNDTGWTRVVVTEKLTGVQESTGTYAESEGNDGRIVVTPEQKSDIPEVYTQHGADEALAKLRSLVNKYPPGVGIPTIKSREVTRIRNIVDEAIKRYRVDKGIEDAEAVYRLFTNDRHTTLEELNPIALLAVAYKLNACS